MSSNNTSSGEPGDMSSSGSNDTSGGSNDTSTGESSDLPSEGSSSGMPSSNTSKAVNDLLDPCTECKKAKASLFVDDSLFPPNTDITLLVPTDTAMDKLLRKNLSRDELLMVARKYVLLGDGSTLAPDHPLKNLDGEEYSITKIGDRILIDGVMVIDQFHIGNRSNSNSGRSSSTTTPTADTTSSSSSAGSNSSDTATQNKLGYFILDGLLPNGQGSRDSIMGGQQKRQEGGNQEQTLDSMVNQDPKLTQFKNILASPDVRQFLPLLRDTPVTFFIPNDDAFQNQTNIMDIMNKTNFLLSHTVFGLFPKLNEHVLFVDLTGRLLSVGKNECSGTSNNANMNTNSNMNMNSPPPAVPVAELEPLATAPSSQPDCVEGYLIVNPVSRIISPYQSISDMQGYYVVDALLI